jgi:transcriptional regulator with XRE-family HTH domain
LRLQELLDVSQQYLSGLEARARNPTIRVLVRLAKALDVDLFTLLAGFDSGAQQPCDGRPG